MSVWDTRYPEHVAVHRSVNGGLVHVGFSVNFMDIFYINCFSHSLYLSRARNISCFSCFLTIIYVIYMPKLNTSGGKGKMKTQGDM